ncbi:MAG: hypothetical protein KF708_16460 [Pirellulales bacterium]|nr:hypothetical protein [Pirellulales bacterium]
MRWNNTRSLALGASLVLTAVLATAAIAAPRDAGSKMRGQDFSFWQGNQARYYPTYRAPVTVESTPAPVVAQTPAPAANNNAAPAPNTAQAPSTGTRRFSAEPAPSVNSGTTYYNYGGRSRSYGSSSRNDFSAGRKSLGTYLP